MCQTDSAEVDDAEKLLAAEADLDGGAIRAMWRWTCYQVLSSSLRSAGYSAGWKTTPLSEPRREALLSSHHSKGTLKRKKNQSRRSDRPKLAITDECPAVISLSCLRAMSDTCVCCGQAAEQIGDEDPHEAGIYGILGGNLRRVAPLCKTWNDKLWAAARTWLEAALDRECPPADLTTKVREANPPSRVGSRFLC